MTLDLTASRSNAAYLGASVPALVVQQACNSGLNNLDERLFASEMVCDGILLVLSEVD